MSMFAHLSEFVYVYNWVVRSIWHRGSCTGEIEQKAQQNSVGFNIAATVFCDLYALITRRREGENDTVAHIPIHMVVVTINVIAFSTNITYQIQFHRIPVWPI